MYRPAGLVIAATAVMNNRICNHPLTVIQAVQKRSGRSNATSR
jgi:hypothetical protein